MAEKETTEERDLKETAEGRDLKGEQENQKKAIVIGSTGATGREVVKILLKRNWIVQTVSRRSFDYNINEEETKRLRQIQSDFSNPNDLIEQWTSSHALFNCLG